MATWDEFASSEPDFARLMKARFDSHKHKMMATLRKDGSPRISGIEATFADGQLWLGMMPGSLKALDLRRDPRVALHSASVDPDMPDGDAKIAGRAIEHTGDATKAGFAGTLEEAGQEMPEGPSTSSRSISRKPSSSASATPPITSSSRPGATARASNAPSDASEGSPEAP